MCDFGTGVLGNMGLPLIKPAFSLLNLSYPLEVECSINYKRPNRLDALEIMPDSSHLIYAFEGKNNSKIHLHWMDGNLMPLIANELIKKDNNNNETSGTVFIGTKGKMISFINGSHPKVISLSDNTTEYNGNNSKLSSNKSQVLTWIDGCIAGYSSKKSEELNSNFKISTAITEAVLLGNLAKQTFKISKSNLNSKFNYPNDYIKLNWDTKNMSVKNFKDADQFVKRIYRKGWRS